MGSFLPRSSVLISSSPGPFCKRLTIGTQAPSGSAATPSQVVYAPMWVRLELDDLPEIPELPVGASGTGAIYTDRGAPTQIIRRVMVRMDAILNYLLPM